MASVEIKLPEIGEGVNEGEIVRWLVKEGDFVKHDQPLIEIMTDKATVEIPCSSEGKVTKLLGKEGQVVKVGSPLLVMETGAAQESKPKVEPAKVETVKGPPPSVAKAPMAEPVKMMTIMTGGGGNGGQAERVIPPPAGANVLATPATRRYARELGVDLNDLKGTGPIGRVTRDDVSRAAQGTGAVAAARPQFQAPVFQFPKAEPGALEERKPFRGIRKKIAENLVRSKQTIPHFTHADEADVTALVQWRNQLKDQAAAQGVKLTYLPLIMKAVVATCREFPQFNASIDDAAGEIVYKHYFNVGFAADTPEGLLVPVVKNVESKDILQIAHEIATLAEKARAGKLAPDDMKHGTITITNIGSVGGISATPIINPPEVAIIGVYQIIKKPVVIDDEIKIREMMGVTATCDHRLVDGAQAARFLKKFMARLSNPNALLLDMV